MSAAHSSRVPSVRHRQRTSPTRIFPSPATTPVAGASIRDLKGVLHRPTEPVALQDMDEFAAGATAATP